MFAKIGSPETSRPSTKPSRPDLLEFRIVHQAAEAHERGGLVRHLDADERFARDRRFDADRVRRERERKVGVQRRDARKLHAFRGLQRVARDGGADVDLAHLHGDAEAFERALDDVRVREEVAGRRFRAVGVEERERRRNVIRE